MSDAILDLKIENNAPDEESSQKRLAFVSRYQSLFWYMDKSKLADISDTVLIEFILNYGDLEAVKELFELLGKNKVASVFRQAIRSPRNNYFPQVANFFQLYFNAHIPKCSV